MFPRILTTSNSAYYASDVFTTEKLLMFFYIYRENILNSKKSVFWPKHSLHLKLPNYFQWTRESSSASISLYKTCSKFYPEYHFLLSKQLFLCERNAFNITPCKIFLGRRVQKRELSCFILFGRSFHIIPTNRKR